MTTANHVEYQTDPSQYKHWKLEFNGPVATLAVDIDENAGLRPGYKLKLNSYDLGVDIELNDAVSRIRFEHPEVRTVVVTSAKEKVFCSGANIFMLGVSSHSWKVNFCKFTNETRNGLEDSSKYSGLKFLAAVNGACAGGGYELALACDEIVLIDDGSSTVSLPEVPLLGVLPGTGGLTRVVDKRHVRKDRADLFATRSEGYRGATAVGWGLVDATVSRARWDSEIESRAARAVASSQRRAATASDGVALTPLSREDDADGTTYRHVRARFDRAGRRVEVTVLGPAEAPPADAAAARAQGVDWWPLAVAREIDDLVLRLRTNEQELGTWVLRTEGDLDLVLAHDARLRELVDSGDWFAHETSAYLARTFKRLDVTSRSLVAVVEPGSCFGGLLTELALACDRQYMLDGVYEDLDPDADPARLALTASNDGPFPMGNGLTRMASRFWGRDDDLERARAVLDQPLDAREAEEAGMVTMALDDLDLEDELRIVLEERASLSPDALTGMEANHRFVGPETMETKIFGRLTAWQNWIFLRPNASGPDGALRRYGTGQRGSYDHRRV